jgi:hypothetical protein
MMEWQQEVVVSGWVSDDNRQAFALYTLMYDGNGCNMKDDIVMAQIQILESANCSATTRRNVAAARKECSFFGGSYLE